MNDQVDKIRKGPLNYRLKFLLKDTLLYGSASVLSKALYIFTLPVLTRVFTKAEYGTMDGITVLATLFSFLALIGQDSAVARFFYDTDDKDEKKQIICQSGIMVVLASIGITAIMYVFGDSILDMFMASSEHLSAYKLMVLSLTPLTMVRFMQNLLKWTFNRVPFLIMSVGSTFSVLLLTIFNVVQLDMGIEGVFWAQLIGMGFFSVLGFWFCREYIILPKGNSYYQPLLKYGWPLMIMGVCGALVPSIDRYFIINTLDLTLLGIYGVAFKIASLVKLPIGGFQNSWGPFAFAIYKEDTAEDTYNKVLIYYVSGLSILMILIISFSYPLIHILASAKYAASIPIILPLSFSIFFESFYWITGIGIGLSKRPIFYTYNYLISLAITICAVYILIDNYGIIGVAYGILIGRIFLAVIGTFFGLKLYPVRFNLSSPLFIFIICFTITLIISFFSSFLWYVQIGVNLSLLLMFTLLIWHRYISKEDKEKILQAISQFPSLKRDI